MRTSHVGGVCADLGAGQHKQGEQALRLLAVRDAWYRHARKAAPPTIGRGDRAPKGTAAAKIFHWRCIPSNTPSTLDDLLRFPP